jgi:hypothetical protein
MSVVRQVHAKELQAKLKSSDSLLQARAIPSILFSAVPANDDVIT